MAGNLVQGAVFTVMVVRAEMLRDPAFEAELAVQVQRSPRFFLNAPVVLDLKETGEFAREAEFAEAKEILRRHTLTLIGIQNAAPVQADAAAAAGLAGFAPNATQPSRPRPAQAAPGAGQLGAGQAPQGHASSSPTAAKSRLITQPVRSGTQIYARGADLVVTAPVSPGAEIMADGNIHVYAALRGRALAGANGDAEARIFCSRLEAELVSIAGHYLVSDQIPPEHRGLPVQIALVDDRLTIERN
ncbi:MAG TPA: septum site-determining protein MinC [Stellaceae bacterium]|jgi:septum site-determining protein MinC|nr:septum site-determining protein MinC [Stellaceae bacterium]